MKITSGIILILCCLSVLSCSNNNIKEEHNNSIKIAKDSNNEFEDFLYHKADSLLQSMTLEQRIGQCFIASIFSSSDPYTMRMLDEFIADGHIGGVLLLKGDLSSANKIAAEASESEVPLFVAIDAEWGLGMRLQDAPKYPKNGEIKEDVEETLLFEYGREMARECRKVGINMVLGPVIDVTERKQGIIGLRSFGSDPQRVAVLGSAYARGLESGGVLSVAKHFPGHGSTMTDSHKYPGIVYRDNESLDSIDLFPFKEYIGNGLSGVMVGHLIVPSIDTTGVPAAMSKAIINDLLKEKMNFKGLVITDALSMGGAEGYTASDALKAGADIVVGPANLIKEINSVMEALKKGEITPAEINEKCRRIIFYKLLMAEREKINFSDESLKEEVKGSYSDSLNHQLRY